MFWWEIFCPTLTKGSKWQITQIWESDVFRLDVAYSASNPSLEQKHSSCWKIINQGIMILHWCQCTWQTHFAHLQEMSFSRVASFCQSTAVFMRRVSSDHTGQTNIPILDLTPQIKACMGSRQTDHFKVRQNIFWQNRAWWFTWTCGAMYLLSYHGCEQERHSMEFRCKPERRYHHTLCMAIVSFWFSTEHSVNALLALSWSYAVVSRNRPCLF